MKTYWEQWQDHDATFSRVLRKLKATIKEHHGINPNALSITSYNPRSRSRGRTKVSPQQTAANKMIAKSEAYLRIQMKMDNWPDMTDWAGKIANPAFAELARCYEQSALTEKYHAFCTLIRAKQWRDLAPLLINPLPDIMPERMAAFTGYGDQETLEPYFGKMHSYTPPTGSIYWNYFMNENVIMAWGGSPPPIDWYPVHDLPQPFRAITTDTNALMMFRLAHDQQEPQLELE